MINNHISKNRTKISGYGGVYPIPLYTKPFLCGGECFFCPNAKGIPKSYLRNIDTEYAESVRFSPKKQLERFLAQIPGVSEAKGIPLEIIILGGSFCALTREYRLSFIEELYNAISLVHESAHGPRSRLLCSILSVESRPDQINEKECLFLKELGVSKIEIGVQHTNDEILKFNNRNHSLSDVIKATELMKSFGFKVGYHIMLGLPGSNKSEDAVMMKSRLWESDLSPDFLKIYPCELLKPKELQPFLWSLYDSNQWKTLTREYIINLLNECISNIPRYVRIQRIMRQFPKTMTIGEHLENVHERYYGRCKCIRCREAGKKAARKSIEQLGTLYLRKTENCRDTYFEINTIDDTLVALARVFTNDSDTHIVRELHVYGVARHLKTPGLVQGNGIGTTLLNEIEKTFLSCSSSKILINAAMGAKGFFLKRGYKLSSDTYLIKYYGENKENSCLSTQSRLNQMSPDNAIRSFLHDYRSSSRSC